MARILSDLYKRIQFAANEILTKGAKMQQGVPHDFDQVEIIPSVLWMKVWIYGKHQYSATVFHAQFTNIQQHTAEESVEFS